MPKWNLISRMRLSWKCQDGWLNKMCRQRSSMGALSSGPWPTSGTVHDYLVRFRSYLHCHLVKSDVYLVFDRYIESSTKEATRRGRDKEASSVYTLRCTACLPPQKVILTVTTNKDQLIALIVEDLVSHKADFQKQKLVVTGRDSVPVEIANGCVNKRQDMTTMQGGRHSDCVTSFTCWGWYRPDHCRWHRHLCSLVVFQPPGQYILQSSNGFANSRTKCPRYQRSCRRAQLHRPRSTSCSRSQHSLNLLGNTGGPPFSEVVDQATHFMLDCYGLQRCHSMTEARQQMWFSKVSRSKVSAPKLCSLPPTSEAFGQNVARAHLQVAIWHHALDPKSPVLDPTSYGWSQEEGSTALSPTTVPPDTALSRTGLLKLIKCSCRSEMPRSTNKCSCNSSDMAYSPFCACQGGQACQNESGKYVLRDEDEEDWCLDRSKFHEMLIIFSSYDNTWKIYFVMFLCFLFAEHEI